MKVQSNNVVFKWFMISATSLGVLVSCDKKSVAETYQPAPDAQLEASTEDTVDDYEEESELIEAGDQSADASYIPLVFFYTPGSKGPSEEVWRATVEEFLPGMTIATEPREGLEPPFIPFSEDPAPIESVSVPDIENLNFFGRGMSMEDKKTLQKTNHATLAGVVMPKDKVWNLSPVFNRLAYAYAIKTGAFIYDSATRETFHPDAWKKTRIEGWGDASVPDIRSQITTHLYPNEDGSLRAITLGMEKFGLPDVVVENLASSQNAAVGNLIHLVCQSIATTPVISDPAEYKISLAELKSGKLRESYQSSVMAPGTGNAVVSLVYGESQDGDPNNSLISLEFTDGDGETEEERMASVLSGFWGTGNTVMSVRADDAELEALSEKAKRMLLVHKKAFQAGLPSGSRLAVKAPFTTDDGGTEWMWVEVKEWSNNGTLKGLLQNDPKAIKNLRAGAEHQVEEGEIFDYILTNPDGTTEGNETGKLIEKMQQTR